MKHTARRATPFVGALVAASSLFVVGPAQTATLAPSTVTAYSDNYTPDSGETFHVYGAVWSQGDRVPATVSVKTFRDGKWVPLSGATMHTNSNDQYKMRIILQMKGKRLLRVVGDPDSSSIKTSTRTISVTVG